MLKGKGSDTVSLRKDDVGFRYEMCRWELVILEHDLNPFSKHSRSEEFLSSKEIEKYKDRILRVGPIYPLVVFDHPKGFVYIGPLELYYAYDEALKTLSGEGEPEVYVAVLPQLTPLEKIIEASILLNPDENIPNTLYRLKRMKALIDMGLTDVQVQKFLQTGKSNSAFATMVRRDLKLCRNEIVYECVTGITPDDEPLQLPRPEKAKLSYTLVIKKLLEKLGDSEDLWKKFLDKLNEWIKSKRGYELPSDENLPYFDRQWYKRENNRPLKIALELLDEKYQGPDSSVHISRYKPWDISVTDDNVRKFKASAVELDLKDKSDDNIKLIVDVGYKMELSSRTFQSYLMSIAPVDHGDKVRGKASMDDKTIELRSNLSEFDGYNYALFILMKNAVYYADRQRLIKSLGLAYQSFGFKNSSDKQKVKDIRAAFLKWDRENSYKYEEQLLQFNDLKAVLGRRFIYKILKETIFELDSSSDQVVTFEEFFLPVFSRSFKLWQVEYDKSKKEANSILLDKDVKKFYRKMKKKKPLRKAKDLKKKSKATKKTAKAAEKLSPKAKSKMATKKTSKKSFRSTARKVTGRNSKKKVIKLRRKK